MVSWLEESLSKTKKLAPVQFSVITPLLAGVTRVALRAGWAKVATAEPRKTSKKRRGLQEYFTIVDDFR
jgi:hypothetical protein